MKDEKKISKQLNEYWSKLKLLKPEFDKVRKKSYEEALKFWEEKIMPLVANHPLETLSNPLTLTLFLDNREKVVLTIAPASGEEEEQNLFNQWYLIHYSNLYCNLDKAKEIFFETQKKSPNPKKYLQSEIEKLEKQPQRKVYNQNERDRIFSDYELRGVVPDWRKEKIETVKLFAPVKFKVEYLVFLKEQLNVPTKENKNQNFKKLVWNGSQKELAELFIELQKKKYIEEINMGSYDFNEIAENICNLFDLTKTKKKKESNENKSFYQILKGEPDEHNKTKRNFPKVYSGRYKKKFTGIKPC